MAEGISDSGAVAGSIFMPDGQRACLWDSRGYVTDLGLDAAWAGAMAINNRGQAVGWYYPDPDRMGAFMWDPLSGLTIIQPANGVATFGPVAVNDDGLVVGNAQMQDGSGAVAIWMVESGFTILGPGEAYDINNKGQVAGKVFVSHDPDGSETWRAVVWEPVPEPSSLMALAFGLAGLVALRRKKGS